MPDKCPFTGEMIATITRDRGYDRSTLSSPAILGEIKLTSSALVVLQNHYEVNVSALRRWIVEQRLGGSLPSVLREADIKGHNDHREWPLVQRAEQLFAWLTRSFAHNPLGRIPFDKRILQFREYLAASDSPDGAYLALVLGILEERGWIVPSGPKFLDGVVESSYRITPSGWLAAEAPGLGSPSDRAFVAMWFGDVMRDAREAIQEAVSAAGYRPVIIDGEEYVGPIVDRILGEIRSARFVVADYTCGAADGADGQPKFQARGGVYYEAGFAHGLGIPVISTVRQDLLGHHGAVHFDVAQYNHIAWTSADELRERLTNRIGAVVGWGPNRPASGDGAA